MTTPAIFFDRDNTVIINDGYLGDPAGVVLMPGAAKAVARAHELGYAVVVVSNQSGVAKGLFTEADVEAVDGRVAELLVAVNPMATIDRQEFCPFHPQAVVERYRVDSELRKPKPGMILRAAAAMKIDLARSWVIGDAGRDIQAGKAVGCRTILFRPVGVAVSPESLNEATASVDADAVVESLVEALDFIERSTEWVKHA